MLISITQEELHNACSVNSILASMNKEIAWFKTSMHNFYAVIIKDPVDQEYHTLILNQNGKLIKGPDIEHTTLSNARYEIENYFKK